MWTATTENPWRSATFLIAIAVGGVTLFGTACGWGSSGRTTARGHPGASPTVSVAATTASIPTALGSSAGAPSSRPPTTQPPQTAGQPATPMPTPTKVRFLNWLQTQGDAKDPVFEIHCGAPGYDPCPAPLTAKGMLPPGTTRCTPTVTFLPADAWHLTAADAASLAPKDIQAPTIDIAWYISIPDRPTPAWPNREVNVDWVVMCAFPDGETIGYEHVMAWVPAILITQFTPTSGPPSGGTTVRVSGHGFTNASMVTFGSGLGQQITVIDDNTLTVVSPMGTAGASVDIVVTSPAGTSHGSSFAFRSFDYIAPSPTPSS